MPPSCSRDPETPRKRKPATHSKLPGLRSLHLEASKVAEVVRKRLKLDYDVHPWQATLIQKIVQGYDSIFVAGTGYGKSLVFEGVAAMQQDKTVLVICPLKVLEHDQVREAEHKGLRAIAINEDTIKADPKIWTKVTNEKFNLIYISPELAISSGTPFMRLWKDKSFRNRLAAAFVDEGHCIKEWGDNFREEYRLLRQLRSYTGFGIPVVSCSATMPTSTFDVIWDSLDFGHRPFWGLDVGTDRENLFYIVRPMTDPKNALLDILNILPATLTAETKPDDIPKGLLYSPSPASCASLVQDLRKCLPEHLRPCVRNFSAGISEKAKEKLWESFREGEIRILISTEATAMGCNDRSITWCIVILTTADPKSLSVVIQRWGRTGRQVGLLATCVLLVPQWAIRPPMLPLPDIARIQGKTKLAEPKASTTRRAKLHEPLEELANLGHDGEKRCIHGHLSTYTRPETKLDIHETLGHDVNTVPKSRGSRSLGNPSISLTWTVVDLNRHAPPERCCCFCNPTVAKAFSPPVKPDDPRFSAFATDFIYPLAKHPPLRANSPESIASHDSHSSTASHSAAPKPRRQNAKIKVPSAAKISLTDSLEVFREGLHTKKGSSSMFTAHMIFPDRLMKAVVADAAQWIAAESISVGVVQSFVKWNLASEDDWMQLVALIQTWKSGLSLENEPVSGRGNRKKSRIDTNTQVDKSGDDPAAVNPARLLWPQAQAQPSQPLQPLATAGSWKHPSYSQSPSSAGFFMYPGTYYAPPYSPPQRLAHAQNTTPPMYISPVAPPQLPSQRPSQPHPNPQQGTPSTTLQPANTPPVQGYWHPYRAPTMPTSLVTTQKKPPSTPSNMYPYYYYYPQYSQTPNSSSSAHAPQTPGSSQHPLSQSHIPK